MQQRSAQVQVGWQGLDRIETRNCGCLFSILDILRLRHALVYVHHLVSRRHLQALKLRIQECTDFSSMSDLKLVSVKHFYPLALYYYNNYNNNPSLPNGQAS